MLKDLYIIGAGGFGREVAWLVERINSKELEWNIKGFLDENELLHGKKENGYTVVGGLDYLIEQKNEFYVVCAVGSAKARKRIIERIKTISNIKFATLIDPSVIKSDMISIGEGSVVCAANILTVNIDIGCHVHINLDCSVGHDVIIEDYVTVYPSVNISGNVHVGKCSELGTGTAIIQGIEIGVEAIIGAGAVVIRNIPDKCTAVGNPAKVIKYNS